MSPGSLLAVAVALVVSLLLAQALVLSAHKHGHLTMDLPTGIQKFHFDPTPRVGGIAIYIGVVAGWLLLPGESARTVLATVLLAGMPALAIGLLEDVTKRVTVRTRLLVTMASGAAAALITGVGLTRVDIPAVDMFLSLWPLAVLFTAFAVGGVANAVNIIDGFHGLASGTVIISSLALAAIAHAVGDKSSAITAVVLAAAVAGFWLVNFPRASCSRATAELISRASRWRGFRSNCSPATPVSPRASVLLCGYPTLEVAYSVMRRRKVRQSPGMADRHHLHSLVATQLVQPRLPLLQPNLRNAAVSVVMWTCAFVPVVPAVLFFSQPELLLPAMAGCVLAYHLLYRWVASSASAPVLAGGANADART
ncbi:glycosyl transferase 4 family protein [Ramlibacter terrae]|uniref:Glycosyl transferase 4 family protein n=1 Tax=Ramlibacter terrae TaxID=2732511 RepID=A0ABX6P2Y5_9BURK|nr:glycosyl transferase 4 family protein [Ramlibacter terrae]